MPSRARGQALGDIGHAVDNFIGGAVAARGNDGGEAVAHGLGGQAAGFAGRAGAATRRSRGTGERDGHIKRRLFGRGRRD